MIKFRAIEAFQAVIEHATVTKAADYLRLSQPAVSRLIADLEHSTRLRLFSRERQRLIPTPEGMILYNNVARLFSGLKDLERLTEELRTLRSGSLTVVTLQTLLGRELIPRLLPDFMARHPGVRVSHQVHSSHTVVDWMQRGQAEVGITLLPLDNPHFTSRTLCRLASVCALPAGHRLAKKRLLRPQDLAGEDFVSFSFDTRLRDDIDAIFKEAGVQRRLTVDSYVSDCICWLVGGGMGVALVDPFTAVAMEERANIVVRRFEPGVPFEYRIITSNERPLSLPATLFLDWLDRTVNDYIEKKRLRRC